MVDFEPVRGRVWGTRLKILFVASILIVSRPAAAQNDLTLTANTSTKALANFVEVAQQDPQVADQSNAPAQSTLFTRLSELRAGPFDLHPRLDASLTYDDNILLSPGNKEVDTIWQIQPGVQAVAGDDAALIAYRDQHSDVLGLTAGNLIIQQPEDRPGKLLILDYGAGFQFFDKYTANNFVDQLATINAIWPMNKLILAIRQDYTLQKIEIIEFDQRTAVETIPTTLSAAYQFDDKSSIEANLRRTSIDYESAGLIGYTEYSTEDWFNYKMEDKLTLSLGALAGVALRFARNLLTRKGVLVASIPNVAHFATVWNLVMGGNWEYTDQGTLDRTHLRFFTRRSIIKMFESEGYQVARADGINGRNPRKSILWTIYRLIALLPKSSIQEMRYLQFAIVAKPIHEL
jgi:hypothetical protein